LLITLLTICGIVLLLVVSGLIGTAFFPGLPYYLVSRLEFKHLDVTMTDYPGYDIPVPVGQSIPSSGFSISLPASFELIAKTDTVHAFEDKSLDMAVFLQLERTNSSLDWSSILNTDHGKKYTEEFEKYVGPFPNTSFEQNRIFLSISSHDFLLGDRNQSQFMSIILGEKEVMIGVLGDLKSAYWYERGDIQGMLTTNSVTLYNFQFINKNEPDLEYQISFLRQIDLPTVYSVINSIQWNDNLDGEPTPTPGNGQIG
jgi:hypothetical protein